MTREYKPDPDTAPVPNHSRKPNKPAMPDMDTETLKEQGLVQEGESHWRNPASPLDKSMGGNWATVIPQSKRKQEDEK